jgi:hypothetical protein
MKRNLTPADKFQIAIAALLLASESNREDLIPSLKAAALSAARQMNGQGPSQMQRQRAAKQRGQIRRVANQAGEYQ